MVKALLKQVNLILMFANRILAISKMMMVKSVIMQVNLVFIAVDVISRNLFILKKEKRLRKMTYNHTYVQKFEKI